MNAPHKYRVFARDLGTFTCEARTNREAVVTIALRLADMGLMHERDAGRTIEWCVVDDPKKVSRKESNTDTNERTKQ